MDVPVRAVCAVLADVPRWPHWDPHISGMRRLDSPETSDIQQHGRLARAGGSRFGADHAARLLFALFRVPQMTGRSLEALAGEAATVAAAVAGSGAET